MGKRRSVYLSFLLGPGAFWLLMFFVIPSLLVVVYSFMERSSSGGVIWNFSLEA